MVGLLEEVLRNKYLHFCDENYRTGKKRRLKSDVDPEKYDLNCAKLLMIIKTKKAYSNVKRRILFSEEASTSKRRYLEVEIVRYSSETKFLD